MPPILGVFLMPTGWRMAGQQNQLAPQRGLVCWPCRTLVLLQVCLFYVDLIHDVVSMTLFLALPSETRLWFATWSTSTSNRRSLRNCSGPDLHAHVFRAKSVSAADLHDGRCHPGDKT